MRKGGRKHIPMLKKKTLGYHYELLPLKIDTCPHKVFWWREKKVLRNSHLFFPLLPTVHSLFCSPSTHWGPVSLFPSHTSIMLTVWPFQTTTGNFNWTDLISILGGEFWYQETMTQSPSETTTLIFQARLIPSASEGTKFSLHFTWNNKSGTQLKLALSGRD